VPGGLIEYFLASQAGLAEVLYQLDGNRVSHEPIFC
jgi:hypothetical protein